MSGCCLRMFVVSDVFRVWARGLLALWLVVICRTLKMEDWNNSSLQSDVKDLGVWFGLVGRWGWDTPELRQLITPPCIKDCGLRLWLCVRQNCSHVLLEVTIEKRKVWCQKELLQKTGRFERTMNEKKEPRALLESRKNRKCVRTNCCFRIVCLFVCFSTNIQRAIKYTRIYA